MQARAVLLAAALVAAACGEGKPRPEETGPAGTESPGAAATTPAGTPEGLIAGTPPGGLEDWVADIREGTAGLTERALTEGPAAQRVALDLYIGRQEYIEMYYGPGGRLHPAGATELGETVLAAEQEFHDLLQRLAVQPPDTAAIRLGVDSLGARLERVVRLAKAAGATLVPPGNPPATGGE